VLLEDLHSRNGTFLDGRRIEGPAEVRDGATIGLGPVTLTFVALAMLQSTKPDN
jgi:pSer/pThr/pTyr-binding forkhead associated (FHA) protein